MTESWKEQPKSVLGLQHLVLFSIIFIILGYALMKSLQRKMERGIPK
jgi:hypothetical protein